jgi:hypothetical protein
MSPLAGVVLSEVNFHPDLLAVASSSAASANTINFR